MNWASKGPQKLEPDPKSEAKALMSMTLEKTQNPKP